MEMKAWIKVCLAVLVGIVAVRASVVDNLLKVPLFQVGGLWLQACQDFFTNIKTFILRTPDFSSPWTYAGLLGLVVTLYYMYQLFFAPLNRIRLLGDLGYIPEGKMGMKETANIVQRRRKAGKTPPVYPNGWFGVVESRTLGVRDVKNVSCLGLNLAVFRGEDGRAHIIDAYCPHIGANLAVGGRVFGSCLECPFHGWRFRGDDGKCTHIPYGDKIPDVARVKSYPVHEINGFIHIWYHAEGVDPTWMLPEIEEITRGDWVYRGRTEHYLNAHIEEVPENGADLAHLGQVHGPLLTAGIDLRHMWNKLWDFGRHEWHGEWTQNPEPNQHIGSLKLTHSIKLFGRHVPILDMYVHAKQIGPGVVHLVFDSPLLGRGAFTHYILPVEPLVQKLVHQVYYNWWGLTIVGKLLMASEAIMVERDIMIWNNKVYPEKPVFIKCKEDAMLAKHRRWYSQFYSENSPTLHFKKDTLDW